MQDLESLSKRTFKLQRSMQFVPYFFNSLRTKVFNVHESRTCVFLALNLFFMFVENTAFSFVGRLNDEDI